MKMDFEKIVDYSFEKDEKSNVLAIHPTRPLIAYLINIQRTPKISKGWSSGNDSIQSSSSSHNIDKNKTVSIRIIDYVTRQRCLAKGIYHARPADCVFTINSILCSQAEIFKLAVVDRLANIYLYDLSYFLNELTATRIAVIRGPSQDVTPFDYINLVWCPFVPCEDFDDGDGGLRLALATNSRIEIFAIDRLQGRTGELQRNDLKGAYKCINDAHNTDIVSLSISPDCSTISAAALDNRITFFSSDIDDSGQRCLHNWEANITDKSHISKLFFLDDYPKLLEDSTMKFWGAAFIGTTSGQMLLVDLRKWTVYQKMYVTNDATSKQSKNFDYRIDMTSRNVIALNGNQCYIVKIEHDSSKISSTGSDISSLLETNTNSDLMNGGNIFNYLSKQASGAGTPNRSSYNQQQQQKSSFSASKRQQSGTSLNNSINDYNGLPRIVKTTKLDLHNWIYSFVIKHKSESELELFTIAAYSLERCSINLNAIWAKEQVVEETPITATFADESKLGANTPHELKRFLQQFDGNMKISSSGPTPPLNHGLGPVELPLQLNQLQQLQLQQQQQQQPAPVLPHLIQQATPPTNVNNLINVPSINAIVANNTATAAALAATTNLINDNLMPKSSVALATSSLDIVQMDRMVEALFTKLNTAFSQGLDEFLSDVKSEVNDLKLKLNGLCRDVRKLQQQLQETRQK